MLISARAQPNDIDHIKLFGSSLMSRMIGLGLDDADSLEENGERKISSRCVAGEFVR